MEKASSEQNAVPWYQELPHAASRKRKTVYCMAIIAILYWLARTHVFLIGDHVTSSINTGQPASQISTDAVVSPSAAVWDLSDIDWTLSNDVLNISVPASLPSHV